MADILIRDVPAHVLTVLDAKAKRLGLSRSEYVRRQLSAEVDSGGVSTDDLTRFADTFADLEDADVMDQAWR